jgi:hypothetical protein
MQRALTIREFGGTLHTAIICIFIWNRGDAIKTLIVAAIIAALHAPIALVTPVSFAGTVDALDSQAGLHVGMTMDESISSTVEFEPGRDSVRTGPAQPGTFEPKRYSDPALGVAVSIQGVAFTLDEAVAKSFRTGLASDAASDDDDLPAGGDRRDFSFVPRNVVRASLNFHDHMKSIAESRFSSLQLLQVDEWDRRDFRPPEWIAKLRDVVRIEGSAGTQDPVQPDSSTPHAGAADSMSMLKESLRFIMFLQMQIQAIDPLILVLLGIVSFPMALLGYMLAMHHQGAPSPAPQKGRKKRRSRPVTPIRRHRKRTQSVRVNTESQN